MRDTVSMVDVMADPSLFDLKVLHNSQQRKRDEAKSPMAALSRAMAAKGSYAREGSGADKAELCGAEARKLRDLQETLRRDMSGTCTRAGIPARFATNERFQQIALQMKATISLEPNTPPIHSMPNAHFDEEEHIPAAVLKARELQDLKSLFNQSQKAVKRAAEERRSLNSGVEKENVDEDTDEILLMKLATTMVNAGVHMLKILRAMDVDGNGCLTEEDWGAGLELLHCTTTEASQAWALINPEHHEEVPIADIESLLRRALWRKGRSISRHGTRMSICIR